MSDTEGTRPAADSGTAITAGTIVAGGSVHRPGWLTIDESGRITDVGNGTPPRRPDHEFRTDTIVPGFVDMHVHGGGGASYTDGDTDTARHAAAFHRGHGTTTTLASLVSAGPDALRDQIDALRPLVDDGTVAGIHLEGPWLSEARCGAHDPATLRAPATGEIDDLLAAGGGTIRMVTLAPERDGAMAAIGRFTAAGVLVAVGHTEATYDVTRAAIDRGARVGTHLFNAMRPLHHREPGPALALLEDERVTVELVGDGVHVHPALAAYVERAAGTGRTALVTDAMSAAGMTDGSYRLGVLDVDVTDGVARVRTTGAIAGSTATMDTLFARARAGLGAGDAGLLGAVAMTARTPARTLGLDDVGDLTPGRWADLVVLGGAAGAADTVRRVYRRGVEVQAPAPSLR